MPDVENHGGEAVADENWSALRQLVQSGRLQIAPVGTDPRQSGSRKLLQRWIRRLAAAAVLFGAGFGVGYLILGTVSGLVVGGLGLLGFAWILKVGSPEPFHRPYLDNQPLFERSYLSGAVVLVDRQTRQFQEYPTEWRRIVTEIESGGSTQPAGVQSS